MDLSNLLVPERILCHCNVQSKKKTLQTIAELLGQSLRAKNQPIDTEKPEDDAENGDFTGNMTASSVVAIISKKSRKSVEKTGMDSDSLSDMEILDALISRERLGSTGLGHGVGLPHSRLSSISEPIAAFVTLDKGVDYESLDGQTVDLVLGLLVPENCNDEHLKILSQLAKRFSDENLREQLRQFEDPEKLYAHLQSLPLATD